MIQNDTVTLHVSKKVLSEKPNWDRNPFAISFNKTSDKFKINFYSSDMQDKADQKKISEPANKVQIDNVRLPNFLYEKDGFLADKLRNSQSIRMKLKSLKYGSAQVHIIHATWSERGRNYREASKYQIMIDELRPKLEKIERELIACSAQLN